MRRSGVTLLELVLVLAVLGLVAGLSLTAVRGSAGPARTLGERAVTRLLEARHEAMRSGERSRAVVVLTEGGYEAWVEARGERVRVVSAEVRGAELWEATPGFALAGAEPAGPRARLEAEYRPSGRTDRRSWRVGVGGRMWGIEFDPVTGEPSLVRGPAAE